MAAIVIDTSAYSRMRAHDLKVIDILAEKTPVIVPAVVVGELEAGFQAGRRRRENEVALEEFLAEPFVVISPVTRETARRYGSIFAELRAAGSPIPTNDIWIAATCREFGAPLLTADIHFEKIRDLEIRKIER